MRIDISEKTVFRIFGVIVLMFIVCEGLLVMQIATADYDHATYELDKPTRDTFMYFSIIDEFGNPGDSDLQLLHLSLYYWSGRTINISIDTIDCYLMGVYTFGAADFVLSSDVMNINRPDDFQSFGANSSIQVSIPNNKREIGYHLVIVVKPMAYLNDYPVYSAEATMNA